MAIKLVPHVELDPLYPVEQLLTGSGLQILFTDDIGRLLVTDSSAAASMINSQADKATVISYLDIGTCDERVNTIVTSSATLGLSYTDTVAYTLTAGVYSPTGITRS